MNKFIKFNSILFSSTIFLLNPICGMGNPDKKAPNSVPALTLQKDTYPVDHADSNRTPNTITPDFAHSSTEMSKSEYTDQTDVEDSSNTTSESEDSSTKTESSTTSSSTDGPPNKKEAFKKEPVSASPQSTQSQSSSSNSPSNVNTNNLVFDVAVFKKNTESFKKTKNKNALEYIRNNFDNINNPRLIKLLQKNNIGLMDIFPNFESINQLKKFALLIKFNDSVGINYIKKDIEEHKNKKWVLRTMLTTPVDASGHTLLHYAVIFIENKEQAQSLIQLFIENGTSATITDTSGHNSLNNKADVIIADILGNNVLHHAVKRESLSIIKKLVTLISSEQLEKMLNAKNKDGLTPFMLAKQSKTAKSSKIKRYLKQLMKKNNK